jgi:tritrans,polycis-undecaprenyl-diphosphate synthase [geranylgeranyl-diphosphate specific]
METGKLNHVAVIPDGNRRWAKKRNILPWQGHLAGVKIIGKILEEALRLKIPYFTIWAGSFDNLTKRADTEIKFLFKLYEEYFLKLAKDKKVHQNEVRVNIIGRWKEISPKGTKIAIEKLINETKNYRKNFLTVLVAYNGVDEMADAIERIANKPRANDEKITPELIKNNLWTKNLPPVDLLIRTGGEPHNSNGFMMWHTTDSQYYFTKTLWPDFSNLEFKKTIEEYRKKERRFGA